MSWTPPDILSPGQKWLQTVDPSEVTEAQFWHCCLDYIEHNIKAGIDPSRFQDPANFFKPGDLQHYCNVRSLWSQDPKAPPLIELDSTLSSLRVDSDDPDTFKQVVDRCYGNLRKWAERVGKNPDDLNETKKERERRLARERMRKMRAKAAGLNVSDPNELELVKALQAAKDNVKAGRAWLKEQEVLAKHAYDSAVAKAKLQRTQTVSACQQHVSVAEQAVIEAQKALDNYRINK